MSDEFWPHSPLSELSQAIKDGSHGTHKRVQNGVPFLSAKNVTESGTLQWGDADDRISEEDYAAICSTFTPRERDLLLTIVGTLGRRALFDGSRVAFQRSVAFVRPDDRKIFPRYLFHAVGSHHFGRQLVRRSNATAQAGLYLGELAKTTIPTPPPPDESPHQSRIAAVLDTVDDAIAKTEAVIAKLRQVRAGRLHDLLTRGLDSDGQLRDPIAHPEQFQDSPLGCIPRDWKVQQLHELVPPNRRITYGIVQPGEFDPNGILLIRGQDYISGWALRESFFKVAPSRHEAYRRSLTRAGDLLICIVGATTGAVAQVPQWIGEANITQTTARVACDPKKLVSRFAFHVLRSELGQHQVRRYVKGSAQPGLNLRDVEVFWAPIPSVDEQNIIARILDTHGEAITVTENELAKLRQLKSGLMTDLLTGRVRVPETK